MTSMYNDCLSLCKDALVDSLIVQQFFEKLQGLGSAPTGVQIQSTKYSAKVDAGRAKELAAWKKNLDKDGNMVPPEKLKPDSESAEFIAIGKSISRNCKNMNFDELVDTYHKQFIALFKRNDMKMKQPSKKPKVMP